METTTALLISLGTLVAGTVIGWLWHALRTSGQHRSQEMEAVRARTELDAARREAAALREQVAATREDGELRLERAADDAERRLDAAREEAERRLAEFRAEAERQLAEVKGDQERAAQQFRALAGEVLTSSNQQFLELAEQRLQASTVKNDETLARREQAIRSLLDPMSKTLDQVNRHVDDAEKARREGHSTLTEHLRHLETVNTELRTGTNDLVAALRSNQTRGVWGELQLRRVVEAAGMLDHVDFDVQVHRTDAEGTALIPDLVVNLAGGKNVVVDSKVPLSAYLKAQSATASDEAVKQLDAHAKDLVKHVDVLAGKAYWSQFDAAPEFVVLFVPAEPILAAAVEQRPDLMEYAMRKRVVVATPMTLVALLRTVGYAWQQDAVAEDAQKVLQTGKELYGRLVTMTAKITKLGRSMTTATNDYNAFVATLETRVVPSARRMVELKVADASTPLEPLKAVEATTRPIVRPELLAGAEGAVVDLGDLAVTDDRSSVEALVEADRAALERTADDGASDAAAG
ncbi:DNA recombination protein RmuC [Isoptericola jiangsuensis]|uniref:DNA recombination protein RmuC n=1 Tax=Isoptericola jiangsuensis TaxID=548579 RepID=A0A2A9EUP2_9MICO|nr:DNA recombination protein RmuC [Isoptericola jiangsuensis]PFG42463.1 DNA recombination protein RmuC [Isoptericola jiangsuensis]